MFKKILKFFNKWDSTEEIWKEIWQTFIKSQTKALDEIKESYFNKDNYPLYKQEYYRLEKELKNINNKNELDIFYLKSSSIFDNLQSKYNTTDLEEKEKQLLYYEWNLNFNFLNNYFKLLRKLWNKYKKIKDYNKAFELFWFIIWWATNSKLIELIRFNDIKFLIKEYLKKWDNESIKYLKWIESVLLEINKKKIIKQEVCIDKNALNELNKNIKKYNEMWIRWYKKSNTQIDDWVCDICKKNEKAWWIFCDEIFPSWHLNYPFHKWKEPCRCYISYSTVNPGTWKLNFKK